MGFYVKGLSEVGFEWVESLDVIRSARPQYRSLYQDNRYGQVQHRNAMEEGTRS